MRRSAWMTALLLSSGAAAADGQDSTLVPCRGQRIDAITVDAQAPTVTGLRRVPVIGNIVRSAHVITRPDVVKGFLLLRVGDACAELRRAESERILRAQPFIADATIDVLTNGRGGVTLEVRTIDEASMILSASLSQRSPTLRGAKVGSANLAGSGILTSISWHSEPILDDRLELRAQDNLFVRKPWVLNIGILRDRLGRDDRAELTLPFRTDLQRFAWRGLIGEGRGHAGFMMRTTPDTGRIVLGFGREYAELGGIGRLGPPGKLSLYGLSFTNERAWPDSVPELLSARGLTNDTAALFAGRFMETKAARVNALLGVRGIRFMRARAFDALRATQDVPMGLQIGTLVGRGIPVLGANSNDLFVASDLYLGVGGQRLAYRLQAQGEGRYDRASRSWDGLVGSGRLARYHRISDARTRVYSVEWSGTERVRVPHALTLGIMDGGVRGYRNAPAIGGRRGVFRVDEQWFVGTPFDFGDFGFAGFTDVGQLWKGDVPYGETTRLRASAGVSLLLAVPMRSTRMWRLEFAAPLNRVPGVSRWELRLSHTDRASFFWREPADVDGARARAVPASIYSWP